MSKRTMDDLLEKVCDELDEAAERISRSDKMTVGDLEKVGELVDIKKNLLKIGMLEEASEYSGDGDWEARGSYNRGSSYAGRKRDSMGRYSRADRGSEYRSGRRMYSRGDGKDEVMEHLEKAMDEATTEKEREAIRRAMKQVED